MKEERNRFWLKLAEYGINFDRRSSRRSQKLLVSTYTNMIEGIQPICFENAKWAYTVGAAIAIKKGCQ